MAQHNVTGSTSGLLDIDRSISSNGTVSLANMRTAMDAYFEDPPQQVEDWAMVLENVGFDGREVKWVSLEIECATLDQYAPPLLFFLASNTFYSSSPACPGPCMSSATSVLCGVRG